MSIHSHLWYLVNLHISSSKKQKFRNKIDVIDYLVGDNEISE